LGLCSSEWLPTHSTHLQAYSTNHGLDQPRNHLKALNRFRTLPANRPFFDRLDSESLETTKETAVQSIKRTLRNYDRAPALHVALESRFPPLERIVLTGTTGCLGSHLLAQLLAPDRMERVWALNRMSLEERQRDSFAEKSLDAGLLDCPELALLESDLIGDKLGLSFDAYDEVHTLKHNLEVWANLVYRLRIRQP
jgi:hypothetical protein